jgi:hypothetical protein
MGEWRYTSTILDLGTTWRWVVSFTPLQLYPRYLLDRRLGGPQRRSGCCGGEKNLLPLLGIKFWSLGRPAHSQSLYRLSYRGSHYGTMINEWWFKNDLERNDRGIMPAPVRENWGRARKTSVQPVSEPRLEPRNSGTRVHGVTAEPTHSVSSILNVTWRKETIRKI